MQKLKSAILAGVAALGLMASLPAHAAVATYEYIFDTSGYADVYGSGASAPIDPFKIDFDVTYDPSLSNGLYSVNLNSPLPAALSAITPTFLTEGNVVQLRGQNGLEFLTFGYDGNNFATPGTYTFVSGGGDFGEYSLDGGNISGPPGHTFFTETGSLTVKDLSAVPEPTTWGLMLLGLGGVGSVLRRRRHAAGVFAA